MSASRSITSRKLSTWARRAGRIAVVGLIVAGTLASLDAEARRMGGGRSFGRQSSSITQRQATPPATTPSPSQTPNQAAQAQRAQPTPPVGTPAAAPNRSRWLAPIAGLAAGLGIAALLSHFGLGEMFAGALANFIVIALLAFAAIWVIRRFVARRRDASGASNAYGGAYGSPTLNTGGQYGAGYPKEPTFSANPSTSAPQPAAGSFAHDAGALPALPPGFDAGAFLRNAKVYFVRLQAAWDIGNLADIREFTTPEMFAEVKVDLDARGAQPNQTDVVTLEAELLGVEDRGIEYFASVRFSGLIRETAGASAEPFVEVWNLTRANRTGEGWLLAGIQQLAAH